MDTIPSSREEYIFSSTTASNVTSLITPESNSKSTGAYVGKIIFLSIVAVFGTLGNILVIVTIRKEKKLRIPGNYFIINLTVSDIIITAFSLLAIIYNLSREISDSASDFIDGVEQTAFCQVSAYLKIIALHGSWYSLAFIALNRYYSVCRRDEYANHFTKKRVLITVFLIWIWILLINMPIMVGWSVPNNKKLVENSTEGYYFSYPRHGPPVVYDRSSHDCMVGVNHHGGYTYANGLFVMCIPLAAIIFCYSLVYMEIVQSRRRMKGAMDAKQLRKRYRRERKISLMLAVVVVVFILCWLPAIIYDYSTSNEMWESDRSTVRLVVNWVALCNSAMNPALYALLSKAFRQGYMKVLLRILRFIICKSCYCRKVLNRKLQNYSFSSSRTTPSRSTRDIRGKSKLRLRSLPTVKFTLSGKDSFADIGNKRPISTLGIPGSRTQSQFVKNKKKSKLKKVPRSGSTETSMSRSVVESKVNVVLTPPSVDETVGVEASSKTGKNNIKTNNAKASNNSENDALQSISMKVASTNENQNDNYEKPVSPTKKNFVPLLEQLAEDNDIYTEQGIYIGKTTPKHKLSVISQQNALAKSRNNTKT